MAILACLGGAFTGGISAYFLYKGASMSDEKRRRIDDKARSRSEILNDNIDIDPRLVATFQKSFRIGAAIFILG